MSRLILHCDLDCFYASVEIRDNPKYKGKPVIIGADPREGKGRGVVSTCSYEARKFGLHSGMPISQAYRRCPHGIYLRPNFEKYSITSKKVMSIIKKYSPLFQQVGIDEAYLDLSEICSNFMDLRSYVENLQQEIYKNIGITISIGCAPTKSLAKIASDFNKPNGITLIAPDNFKEFLKDLDIIKIPGIGKKSRIFFNKKGIKTIGDIITTPLEHMMELFGKHGKWVWEVANGLDNREVKEFHEDRKSISKERTFYEDTDDYNSILSKLEEINHKIHKKIKKHNIYYRTITLKIRFEGFITYTRSKTLPYPIQNKKKVMGVILELFKEFSQNGKKIRLVGIKVSNLEKNFKMKQTNLSNFART
ncbi:MAG: DNA polymerase IV [Promethearchaeota archaeon]|nr:MAG: DNA polymerase IV [Candidatus Lokiarchaeota archaeon]